MAHFERVTAYFSPTGDGASAQPPGGRTDFKGKSSPQYANCKGLTTILLAMTGSDRLTLAGTAAESVTLVAHRVAELD
jgi:hypothetical protein